MRCFSPLHPVLLVAAGLLTGGAGAQTAVPVREDIDVVAKDLAELSALKLALGTATQIAAQRNGTIITLTADGAPPLANATVWLDWYTGPQGADFVLYQDAVAPGVLALAYPASDFFGVATALQEVRALDATGSHTITII